MPLLIYKNVKGECLHFKYKNAFIDVLIYQQGHLPLTESSMDM